VARPLHRERFARERFCGQRVGVLAGICGPPSSRDPVRDGGVGLPAPVHVLCECVFEIHHGRLLVAPFTHTTYEPRSCWPEATKRALYAHMLTLAASRS
jgi:hypothetical protein